MNELHESFKQTASYWHYRDDIYLLDDTQEDTRHALFPIVAGREVMTDKIVFLICIAGSVDLQLNYHHLHISTDNALIVLPGMIIETQEISSNFRSMILLLSEKFTNSLNLENPFRTLLSILRCPTVQLPNGMTDSFRNLFGMLGGILQQPSHPHIEQVVRLLFEAYFYGIGSYLHDSGSQKVITAAEQHTEEFLRLVEKHFREPHSLTWYAEQLNIHPKRLSICVHKTTHQTATEWIDRHRLIEACKLLRTSHTPVKQVAALLGFPNQSTFGTWFKRQTGTCPRSFASK